MFRDRVHVATLVNSGRTILGSGLISENGLGRSGTVFAPRAGSTGCLAGRVQEAGSSAKPVLHLLPSSAVAAPKSSSATPARRQIPCQGLKYLP
jgi:hypothetical protein